MRNHFCKVKVFLLFFLCTSLQALATYAQTGISGTVVDASGLPLISANIVVKESSQATIADLDGKFNLKEVVPGQTLVISYLGFETKEVIIDEKSVYNIVLEEITSNLGEVVVTALGIKRAEKALSYNVQKISSEDLSTVRSANFMNALSGKAAGVIINSSAAGPGAAVKVVMRGAKSLSKNNNALYVIDGIPMYNSSYGNNLGDGPYSTQPGTEGAADINPDDIESISLLTGPSAAALYGYEGANGVVLISTKKGRADKTVVTISNNTTFSSPLMMPRFQQTYGNAPGEVTSWGDKTTVDYKPSGFFNTGTNVSNSLSLSTGNDKSQSYLSVATTNAKGILPNNKYDRYNFLFRNTTSFLNDKFVLDASANYIVQKDKNMVSQGQYFNPLPALYLFPRSEDFGEVQLFERYDDLSGVNSQFWIYGDQGISIQNPYWIMNRMNRESGKTRYKLAASLQYNITGWMNILGRVNVDNATFRNTDKRNAGTLPVFAGPKGFYQLLEREEKQTYADILANINKYVGDFSINTNIGASIKDIHMNSNSISGNLDKITNYFTTENLSRTNNFKIDDDGLRQQSQSIFANAEIGYRSMLYLTLTGRNDWDSALAFSKSGEKSFFYPSAGLSGVISEMILLPHWVSYLKARLSYTSVGTAYDPYITREVYEYNSQTNQYNTLLLYPNYNLKPERTNSYEAGLNMRFFKGALHLDATYYRSNTLHQTFIATLPASSGYTGVYVQAGNVQNSGIEMALGYDNHWNDFGWSSNLTYTYNKNVVKKLADGITNPVTGETISMPYLDKATLGSAGSPVVRLTEGGTMGDIYTNRDWKRDDNGYIYLDPKTYLPSLTDTEYKKLGSLLPKAHAGWKNTFTYKGITLSALISGRFGGLVVSNTQAFLDRYGVSESSAAMREAGGISINGRKVAAQDYFNIVAAGTGQGSRYVYDATNIRLAEVSISYAIPKKWVNNVAGITVGLSGNNLAMIYCKAPFDPELVASASSTFYTGVDYFMQPSLRNFGFNINVQF
ncbi:MAG: SusC/RagA family TonB-linked outer membrane protein [Dysgonamonadaceae bacterium]|jgi:TonB-linked SusC/RagA family outer membrane protein|nr:SusC/RagA family TonB-linked outer membrane protein [Dysgonamonadaceae bacterium]